MDTAKDIMRCESQSAVPYTLRPLVGHEKKTTTPDLPRIITRKELRLLVPYTPQHILRLEKQVKFPKRIPIGARRVGWYLHEVLDWIEKKRAAEVSPNEQQKLIPTNRPNGRKPRTK